MSAPEVGKNVKPRVDVLAQRYGHLEGAALLEPLIRQEFIGRIAALSSFGTDSALLLDMVARIDPSTPVIFLNTGKLFPETMAYRNRLVAHLGLQNVRALEPHPMSLALCDPDGMLWQRDPDSCCRLRKVEPLIQVLANFDALVTGRKRVQAATRAQLAAIEFVDGSVRVNPLAGYSRERIESEFRSLGLPPHPLEADGFLSIGCMPCTDRVAPGEDRRAGRWRGLEKTECGIHGNPRLSVR